MKNLKWKSFGKGKRMKKRYGILEINQPNFLCSTIYCLLVN